MNTKLKNRYVEIPFNPKKTPFFYGWLILAMGTAGVILSIPGQTMGISVFTDELIRILKISRVNLSLAYMIGTITSAILLTPAGKKLDQVGSRNIGTAVIIFFGLLLVFMSFIDKTVESLWGLFPGLRYAVAFILITVSFFFLRFLGQGMLTLISRNMVMKWFDKRRGFANAILGIFTSFGFSLAPRVLNDMILSGGWNGAWRILGFIMLFVAAIIFWLISRDNPGECGMEPDGKMKKKMKHQKPAGHPVKDFTLKEARKTLPFWIFGLTLAMNSMFVTAFTFHVVSIFESVGMTRADAVSLFLPASFISVVVNFTLSLISDYIRLRYILLVHITGLIVAMYFMTGLAPGINLVMFTIGYGLIGGVFNISNSIVWPRYYGTKHLGAITGMIMGFIVAGSAIGPYFFSLLKKISGSYNTAAFICLAIMIAMLVPALRIRRPQH